MADLIPAELGVFEDALAQARFTDRAEYVRGRNAAHTLLRLVDAIYRAKPSMHGDGAPIPDECRFCKGELAGLAKARALITNYLTHTDLDEEPPR
jgi:hypothetical protein